MSHEDYPFHKGQAVIINTALGGEERGTYRQPVIAISGAHEVWVGNRPSAARIVRTRQITEVVTEATN